jgi:Domain of unknown function (DUF5060)/Protein of unknown function (DUF4038)
MRLAALALLAAAALPAQEVSPCNNTPAYSTCELVFEISQSAAAKNLEPYKTVDLRAEFRSPRHRTLALPAYWDGGQRMVVRFAPTEAGDWDYRIASNLPEFEGKTGRFTAAASPSPGFMHPENVHHWAYSERDARGLYQAHLWMGASELPFATEDDATFRAVADARAAQKFNHLRGFISGQGADSAYQGPDTPNLAHFRRLDERIRYLNSKGITADLILAVDGAALTQAFPSWQQRRRFLRYLVGRYAAMNVTWQGVQYFEDSVDTRALLKEAGAVLKELDGYQHPRTSGARVTSAPLLDDGWADFAAYGNTDDQVGAIEHQLFGVPFVNLDSGREDSGAGKSAPGDVDAAALRKRLWNATMNGQSVTYSNTGTGAQYANSPGASQMTVWFDFFSNDTRYWELEPYFDVDGGRALALEDTEYVVYMEKPGPLELVVEKHGYDIYWVNPIDGKFTKGKFKGDHFTGSPPDSSHDWVLHVVREGRVEGMNKSYKFESRDIVLQDVESNSPKVPFTIEQPTTDMNVRVSPPFAAKLTKETRATRTMMWLWTGEVSADGQGYRVLATGQQGVMRPLGGLAKNFPAVMHLRLYGMNANGKVYAVDRAFGLNQ